MTQHFIAHILYILESIEQIEEFISDSPQKLNEPVTYRAVLYLVQTLSESACKLPDDIKEAHPTVFWKRFSKMRNAIVHDYLGDTSQEEIAYFIKKHLTLLQAAMEKQLPEWRQLRARLQDD